MPEIISFVPDLIFASRIRGTAERLGAPCRAVANPAALAEALAEGPDRLVLVDMNADDGAGVAAIVAAKATRPGCRVIAFLSHVQRELADEARAAGADEVMPRSEFVQRLPDLLT